MSTIVPFEKRNHSDLTLPRRARTRVPLESDSYNPFPSRDEDDSEAALRAAWDRLYRARNILEREQEHLRDDRIAFQGEIDALQERIRNVSAREDRMRKWEESVQRQLQEEQEREAAEAAKSTLSKLTRAPFDMARSMFGAK